MYKSALRLVKAIRELKQMYKEIFYKRLFDF